MDLSLIIGAIVFAIILIAIGGGVAYYIWLKTRQKKQIWNARIYQLGEGVRKEHKLDDGKIIKTIPLNDIQPYMKDTLEKVEREPGITVYKLQRLNRTTQEVDSGLVESWGDKDQWVDILFHKGSFTLLKKGYDKLSGQVIFNPMPMSRINMMKGEMAIRKDKLLKEKDILQAITPWIVAGMSLLALVALFYLGVQGMVQISENLAEATDNVAYSTGTKVQPQPVQTEQPKPGPTGPSIDPGV